MICFGGEPREVDACIFANAPMAIADTMRAVNAHVNPGAIDGGDLALVLPFTLRRIVLAAGVLPGLLDRPRVVAHEDVTPRSALMEVRRGWPARAVLGTEGLSAGDGLAAAMAEVDALLASFDLDWNREASRLRFNPSPAGPGRQSQHRLGAYLVSAVAKLSATAVKTELFRWTRAMVLAPSRAATRASALAPGWSTPQAAK